MNPRGRIYRFHNTFHFLGSVIKTSLHDNRDITQSTQNANKAMGALSFIWNINRVTLYSKILLNCCIPIPKIHDLLLKLERFRYATSLWDIITLHYVLYLRNYAQKNYCRVNLNIKNYQWDYVIALILCKRK